MARVLLVDDDPVILRLLEINFRLEGFETSSALRGEAALEAADQDPPDAVVLDVMLPDLDGLEVYRRLRERPALARTPIIFLSARGKDESLPPGATDVAYMTKPFDPAKLVATVRDRIAGTP